MGDTGDVVLREQVRLQWQSMLDAAKTAVERNRLGQFATPPGLADDVIRAALAHIPPAEPVRFLDPAFGTGSFYSALLREAADRATAAVGYEIDPHYGEPARDLWTPTGVDLRLTDFTAAAPRKEAKFNLVVCNPPYVRHHHLTAEQKRQLRQAVAMRTGVKLHGLAGLYCHFLLLSLPWMTRDGIGAWLIPSEFMDVNYGSAVKRFLLDRVSLLHVHRFDPQEAQFGDALVSSAVVLFRNAPPGAEHAVRFSYGGGIASPRDVHAMPAETLAGIAKWTRLPRPDEDDAEPASLADLADGETSDAGRDALPRSVSAHEPGVRLGELFAIKRGLATGANSFFVLTPEQVESLALPREFLRPILPGPRLLETDEVEADEQGWPIVARPRFWLDCRLPPDVVETQHPTLWAYLQHGVAAGVHRGYLCSRREPWYAQEHREPAPFLCTYMGRIGEGRASPFRVILNHSAAVAVNVYLMLYPKPPLAAQLGEDPTLRRAVWSSLRALTGERIVGEGRVYGGGLHKLEPRELAHAPADVVLESLSVGRFVW